MSGWNQDQVAAALRQRRYEEALRIAQEALRASDNLRDPFGYRAPPRQAPGSIWSDGQGPVIEGEFRVVSRG